MYDAGDRPAGTARQRRVVGPAASKVVRCPDGSAAFANEASHASASGVLHAIDLPPITVIAAEGIGKKPSKTERYLPAEADLLR